MARGAGSDARQQFPVRMRIGRLADPRSNAPGGAVTRDRLASRAWDTAWRVWVALATYSPVPVASLIIGLLLRLALAPYTSDTYDVATWFHTALSGFYGLDLYIRPGFSYPPIWGYCLQILGSVVAHLGIGSGFFGTMNPDLLKASAATGDFSPIVTSPAFNLLFKSVLFGFDLLSGLLIYRLVLHLTGDAGRARVSFSAWFLNPFVIYQSAVHGAPDAVVGFALIATIALVIDGRSGSAGAVWALGILTKLSPLIIGPLLVGILAIRPRSERRTLKARLLNVSAFALGAIVALAFLMAPEFIFGSVSNMAHNIFARAQEGITVGGLSFIGLRYLKPWSWLLMWSYDNTRQLLVVTTIAQAISTVAWSIWGAVVARRNLAFGILAGSVGSLASYTLLGPVSNPQYVLWWMPALVVLVFVTKRGYWQLAAVSAASVIFSLGILGPAAILAPLATYTHLVGGSALGEAVIQWYRAPGVAWGASLTGDFLGPAAVVTVVALLSLFFDWWRTVPSRDDPPMAASD